VSRCQSDRASPSRRPVPPLSVLFALPQSAPPIAHGIAVVSVRRASREPLCFMRALRRCKILVFRCHARAARWSARPYGRLTFCPVRVASSRGVSCVREVRACPGPSRRDAWRQKRRPAWKVKLLPNLCTFRLRVWYVGRRFVGGFLGTTFGVSSIFKSQNPNHIRSKGNSARRGNSASADPSAPHRPSSHVRELGPRLMRKCSLRAFYRFNNDLNRRT